MHRTAALIALLSVAGAARAENYLVLPFFNQSGNSSLNWIGDSIAESIREALASEGLMTLDRQARTEAYQRLSVRPYTVLTKATVLKIGQLLDAEQVIYGEFSLKPPGPEVKGKTRGSLQITAYTIDLRHVKGGPGFGELGALEDLATVQQHLAWQTLKTVEPERAPTEADFTKRHPAVRVDAIETYVRGLLASNSEEQHRLFTQAVRLDPQMTQACFELGKLHLHRGEYRSASEWLQKVTPSDVHYREAVFLLGLSRFHMGDYSGAEHAFQTVAEVVPLSEVLNNLGAAESRRNETLAAENFRRALEGDDKDPVYHFNLGYWLWKHGDYDHAKTSFQAVLERNPQDAEARALVDRCDRRAGPRVGDTKMENLERLKANYEENAWWQLKAALGPQQKEERPR